MSDATAEVVVCEAPAKRRFWRPAVEALLVDDVTAAAMLGLGVSFFRELLKSGVIGPEPVKLGRRQLHRVDQLRAWILAAMPDRREWVARKEAG